MHHLARSDDGRRTQGVSHPWNSCRRSGGHDGLADLWVPRAAPEVALVASTARSQELKERALVANAPLRKGTGVLLLRVLAPGFSDNQSALNGAKDVS